MTDERLTGLEEIWQDDSHLSGVALGIGAVAATLGVEAAATYAFGRSAFRDLSAKHALRLEN